MADDEFDLEDPGSGDGTEADLDDFFQPADASDTDGAEAPSVDDFFSEPTPLGSDEGSAESLPMEKDRAVEEPADIFGPEDISDIPGPEEAVPPSTETTERPIDEDATEKGFLARNWLLLAIFALVVVLGGTGGFLTFSLFFKKDKPPKVAKSDVKDKPAKKKPAVKDKAKPGKAKKADKAAPGSAGKASGSDAKTGSATKDRKPDKKDSMDGKAKPGKAGKAEKPDKIKVGKPGSAKKPGDKSITMAPTKAPTKKPTRTPVASTGGPYTVQVGSYMLAASRKSVGYDREWKGVSPSAAGSGPRYLYLKATRDYVINPADRVWAAFGTGTHDKLSLHSYTHNVLSEERLTDGEMSGIADVLEEDEKKEGHYVLSDYKTWGSYKVAKALGLTVKKTDEPIFDDEGNPVLLKSGKNKGKPKTKIKKEIILDPSTIDLKSEELQLNRYRIFFEKYGFPVSRMQIQAIPRDGGTYIAESRGIDKNLYIIPVKRLPDEEVLNFYQNLQAEVDEGFETGFVRICNKWECWEGRRCDGYCEVAEYCKQMEIKAA